jgi:hypothetical protein
MRRANYLSGILTVNAILLTALVADRLLGGEPHGLGAALSPAPAVAGQPDTSEAGGLVSAADQRKVMIAELRKLGGRLEKIEAKLSSGISVKVTDMPEMKLPPAPKESASREAAPKEQAAPREPASRDPAKP